MQSLVGPQGLLVLLAPVAVAIVVGWWGTISKVHGTESDVMLRAQRVRHQPSPEDWRWSSFVHYATGVEGSIEIESPWTATKRERAGVPLIAH
jgi:hypothetical protein